MKKLLKILVSAGLGGGIAVSAYGLEQVVLSDDFQSYTDTEDLFDSWDVIEPPAWAPHDAEAELGSAPDDPSNNTAFMGGAEMARAVNLVNGTDFTNENPLRISFSLWDPVTQEAIDNDDVVGARDFAHIRTAANPLLAFGIHNTADGYNSNVYTFRDHQQAEGFDDWFDSGTERTPGWNEFEVIIREDTFDVFINGEIDSVADNIAWGGGDFADFRLGGNTGIDYDVHFDNVVVEVIPEPSSYAVIFGGLALAGAFIIRRRRSLK